jgi:hypothetical protein
VHTIPTGALPLVQFALSQSANETSGRLGHVTGSVVDVLVVVVVGSVVVVVLVVATVVVVDVGFVARVMRS